MKGYNIAIFTSLVALTMSLGYIHIDKRLSLLKKESETIKNTILKHHKHCTLE